MEKQSSHPLANKFFYKFYNYNVEDLDIIELIPYEVYGYVLRELMFYKDNTIDVRLDPMQYNLFLFNKIKLNFTSQHEKLLNDILELNK